MTATRFSKKMLLDKALDLAKKYSLFFIEDICAMIPCDKKTFYKYLGTNSKDMDSVRQALNENKIKTKVVIRHKWYKSDSFSAQVALYKLIGTKDERMFLSNNTMVVTDEEDGELARSRFVDE